MNQKIVSIKNNGSDFVYRNMTLDAISAEYDDGSIDEITMVGIYYNDEIIIGMESDFYHGYLPSIMEYFLNAPIKKEDALYFTLFFSHNYQNARGKKKFMEQKGVILASDGWGLWPFSSENAKNKGKPILNVSQRNKVANALNFLPKLILVE
ncbi:MAG: hypothetical protein PHF25_00995 [Candidatus Margulisbacteria bacterium]|nr:hypothetical protein [Candidatus Margulisiibacteriota bacterium]